MPAPYFFFRPVLASSRRWAALDWQSEFSDGVDCAAFIRCFADSAASPLAHRLPLILPIQDDFLSQDSFVEAFKNESVLFVLPESSLANGPVIERCKELRRRGQPLVLQIENPETLCLAPGSAFNAVRFDAELARRQISEPEMARIGNVGLKRIATCVDTYEMFDWLSRKGIEWSDSHFLTTPVPQCGTEPDIYRLKLLKRLNLAKQDNDIQEIEAIFREEARLSYDLLRIVNSVAMGLRPRISNFNQTVVILGRRQLQRWLQILIYANDMEVDHAPNPLMQLAAARGRQMELLSAAIDPIPDIPELADNAFITGLFSLLDVLIDLPMDKILKELPLQPQVIDALSNPADNGILGKLLSVVTCGEADNFTTAARTLSNLGISPALHAKSQVTAFYWASRINSNYGE